MIKSLETTVQLLIKEPNPFHDLDRVPIETSDSISSKYLNMKTLLLSKHVARGAIVGGAIDFGVGYLTGGNSLDYARESVAEGVALGIYADVMQFTVRWFYSGLPTESAFKHPYSYIREKAYELKTSFFH